MKRYMVTGIVAAMLVMVAPTVAYAAAPAHDDRADATVVKTLPYSDATTVLEATTEAGEPDDCGNERSVWYRYKATEDAVLVASTEGSDYAAGVAVYQGTLSSMSLDSCDAHNGSGETAIVAFEVTAGHTYFITVAHHDWQDTATGGLRFALRQQPTVTNAVDGRAWVSMRNGRATVTGIARCSADVPVEITVTLTQSTSDGTAEGSNTAYLASCDSTTRWAAILRPYTDADFGNGRAVARVLLRARSEQVKSTSRHRGLKVRDCSIIGTIRSDTLRGTAGDDVVCALSGGDIIETRGGNDKVYAGSGHDVVRTGDGDDFVYGDQHRDLIRSGPGADIVKAGSGRDISHGGPGPDILYGQQDKDHLLGYGGRDVLYGGANADLLDGGGGRDRAVGGKGRDTFRRVETRRQ